MRPGVAIGTMCGALAVLPGCLIMSGSSVEESGIRISSRTLDQVVVGETTREWIVAALGEPTSAQPVEENVEILRYEHSVRNAKGGAVLLLFAGGSERVESRTVYFELTDGVVSRFWTEGATP